MRLALRFVLPLMIVLSGFAYAFVPLVDQLTTRWFIRDLDIRSSLIANTVGDQLVEKISGGSRGRTADFFAKITQDERLYALGFCATPQSMPIVSALMPRDIRCDNLSRFEQAGDPVLKSPSGPLHVAVKALEAGAITAGKLVLVHDMSFVERRSEETRHYTFLFFAGLAIVISLITVLIAQLSWRGWVQSMRSLLRHDAGLRQPKANTKETAFHPIARDLQRLIRELEAETRARDEDQIRWSAESLRAILRGELRGEDVIVVSNREPYIHHRRGERIDIQRPASGLVTALEPIMRACSGTWIAHGSGSADRDTVDKDDRVQVPPDKPAYQIRRLWLSDEEEAGYYFGFANEGLWPLCHLAHVRPTFRSSDWTFYEAVNRKFADAVLEESKTSAPIVLVQDYHFALLPRLIKERLPEATIITFWHIPWPNPESFSICPWSEQVLKGLLGSSILGFHTQAHCNNFVDTVDRLLEARVDRESFRVSLAGSDTAIHRYPISIDWPPAGNLVSKPIEECRQDVRRDNDLPPGHALGVGVDRLDYTKGIIERFRAIERLLELKPEWIGRFSLIQIAAPTRSSIDEYHAHEALVRATASRINDRFSRSARSGPPPIILRIAHHEPQLVFEYYRAAELCFVSSLHDGMNLVAKEFIASRSDERGVLILSQFTGAARELPEALIVNPYDADQCAAALHVALTMDLSEQRDRMRLMRGLIAEFNVYRWAGRMLLDAAIMRRRKQLVEPAKATVEGIPSA